MKLCKLSIVNFKVKYIYQCFGRKVKLKMKNFICELEELTKPYVHIKNKDVVNQKLSRLIEGGFEKLQVVSDFDKTLTKQHENGKRHLSSFSMFSSCPSVTEEHKRIADQLVRKYGPYEVDPTIPHETKVQLMIEWWTKSEEILKGLCVSTDEIERVCGDLCPALRDGTNELFESLEANNVPILVFSAGLGDTVVAVLKHCQVYLSNVEVVSNFLKYNTNGIIEGFQNLLIHIFNKNEVAIKGTKFYHKIEDKEHALLMGDSLGDASMVDGMENVKEVLKIGFLYERSEESLPTYMDMFDIVLVDDQTMDIPRAIVALINSKHIQGDGV